MKNIALLLFSIMAFSVGFSQNSADSISTKDSIRLDIPPEPIPVLNNDLSDLFKTDASELPIGFIGDKFQRFQIIFNEVKKSDTSAATYIIKGKTKVKNNICDFTGTANISGHEISYEKLNYPYPISGNIGMLTGTYLFKEDSTQRHNGTLQGNFSIRFFVSKEKKITTDVWTINSDSSYANNQYIGTWKSYHENQILTCNFGILRVPGSADLDVGKKEFQPNDKYKENGWQNYGSLLNIDWWTPK